jgi:hypothetical protein
LRENEGNKLGNVEKITNLRELPGETLDYKERNRGYGQGEMRIGHPLTMDENSIYAIGFLCQFVPEVMDPLFDLVGGMLTEEKHLEGISSTHANGLSFNI